MPARIYLAGRRGAGKSTAARILAERRGARVASVTEPVYEIARRWFGMEAKDRLLLQRVGDAFRAVDPAWLAKHAARTLEAGAGDAPLLVVDGVRTDAEARWLNDHGWVGALVEAPARVRQARRPGEPPEADRHVTEAAVDALPVAVVLWNGGSLEEFTERVLGLADALLRRTSGARAGV
ncbi:MAG: hypothetical protein QJR08_10110 [Bacillota bacterium]|nr:hypothetical protein [Bacillota bacterium]